MTRAQREAFLAELHVGVVAIERDGAAPRAAPPTRWRTVDYTAMVDRVLAAPKS